MSESKNVSGNPWLVAGVLVALGAALGLGYQLGGFGAAPEGHTPSTQPVAGLESALRYKIPVSMSQPHIGPDDAPVTVVVWGDLRGATARAAQSALDNLRKKHGDGLRVVHRQLPDPANEESVRIHYFARGAFDVANKFWEARARLLETPDGVALTEDALQGIAAELGIDWSAIASGLANDNFSRYVAVDVRFAGIFGVDVTPTFFVNGRRLPSTAAEQLEPSLDALIAIERSNAEQWLARGTAPSKVYDAVIEDGRWSLRDDPIARRAAKGQ